MNAGSLFATVTVNVFPVEPIVAELGALRIPHRRSYCGGDPYESCDVAIWEDKEPRRRKTGRPECDCGADEHNAKVDALIRKVRGQGE